MSVWADSALLFQCSSDLFSAELLTDQTLQSKDSTISLIESVFH